MNLFDPTQWADIGGWFMLMGVSAGTCVLVGVKIAGSRYEDWLEDRVGRSSPPDDVPFEVRWRSRM